MNCPHCNYDVDIKSGIVKICPNCGKEISYGGNTTFFKNAQRGNLGLKDIFSDVFKRHQRGDALKSLLRTPNNTHDMISTWKKPWMFLRFFIFMVLFTILLFYSSTYLHISNEIFFVVGCMVVPLSVMLFVWEMDIHGTVSLIDLIVLLLIGGIASSIVSIELNSYADQFFSGSWTAAFTEEPTKLLISVAFLLIARKRKFYALDGLAIGAIVGAGFAFMENVQYVYNGMAEELNPFYIMSYRSILSIGSHIVYTAPFVGALCHAMNGEKLQVKHFANKKFLFMLVLGMGCHVLNNLDVSIMPFYNGWIYMDLITAVKIVISWASMIYMFNLGVKQALQVSDVRAMVAERSAKATLRGVQGQFRDVELPILAGRSTVLGRMTDCNLVFQPNLLHVSRKHCSIEVAPSGQLIVRDLGSTNGTTVNGNRLLPNQAIELRRGDVLGLGPDKERFEVA